MKCPKCGFDNPDIASYCVNCGARVDGKILCPKCNKPISPDEEKCPHCGKKIPHEKEAVDVVEEPSAHKVSVFNKIFLIVCLVLLASGISVTFGQYVSFTGASDFDYGFSWFYLFKQWNILSNTGSLSNGQIVANYLKVIIPFAVVVINIVICLVFGLIGIVKTFKALIAKGDKVCTSYKYVAVLLCSNIFGAELILSMNDNVGGTYQIPSMMKSYIWTAAAALAVMFLITIFLSPERRRPALLLEKIFFGCTFFLGLYLIYQTGNFCLSSKSGDVRIYSLFESCLKQISSEVTSKDITSLIICSGLYVFTYLNGLIASSLVIFIAIGFFSNKERGMMYKIPTYVLGFIILLTSTISLILNTVICIMLNVNAGEIVYLLGDASITQFVTANLLFGSTVTCLGLTKGYRNYQRIVSMTSKK